MAEADVQRYAARLELGSISSAVRTDIPMGNDGPACKAWLGTCGQSEDPCHVDKTYWS